MTNNDTNIREVAPRDFPPQLLEIPQPPKKLHIIGEIPSDRINLCVVGSRRPTPYGVSAVENIIAGLAGFPFTIVSGLALGIDTLAHKAALEAHLPTIAVPGSGLNREVLYPSSNRELARKIIESGGALLSEFEPDFQATPWSFPQRNRIMAGLADAVILIEAEEKSGTLITARMASDYNRDLMCVPGSIFSSHSKGTNFFIKLGAIPITESSDILKHFNLEAIKTEIDISDLTPDELILWNLLECAMDKNQLVAESGIGSERASIALSLLEIKGRINERMGLINRVG